VETFALRAKTLARRYGNSESDLHAAVDELQQLAEANGLVAAIGQNAVQTIVSEAFAAVRSDLPRHTMAEPATRDNPLTGIDWSADWGTDASAHMFARVRELCGAHCGPPELTPEMIAAARQEARDAFEQAEELEAEGPATADNISSEQELGPVAETSGARQEDLDHRQDGDSWAAPSWREAAIDYHKERGKRASTVSYTADELRRLRAMMDDNISLERVWRELNRTPGRAASSTVEALMHSLRERGTAALEEPTTRRRLGELSKDQLAEVGDRLQRLKPEIARAWSANEIHTLVETYGRPPCR
jgi:transposase